MKLPPHRERTATHTQLDDWEPPVSPNAAQPSSWSSWCWLCVWVSRGTRLSPHCPLRGCAQDNVRHPPYRACFWGGYPCASSLFHFAGTGQPPEE